MVLIPPFFGEVLPRPGVGRTPFLSLPCVCGQVTSPFEIEMRKSVALRGGVPCNALPLLDAPCRAYSRFRWRRPDSASGPSPPTRRFFSCSLPRPPIRTGNLVRGDRDLPSRRDGVFVVSSLHGKRKNSTR